MNLLVLDPHPRSERDTLHSYVLVDTFDAQHVARERHHDCSSFASHILREERSLCPLPQMSIFQIVK